MSKKYLQQSLKDHNLFNRLLILYVPLLILQILLNYLPLEKSKWKDCLEKERYLHFLLSLSYAYEWLRNMEKYELENRGSVKEGVTNHSYLCVEIHCIVEHESFLEELDDNDDA